MVLDIIIDERTIVNNLSRDELIEFIKEIDRMIAEYDFTAELRDYFVAEMKEEERLEEEQK